MIKTATRWTLFILLLGFCPSACEKDGNGNEPKNRFEYVHSFLIDNQNRKILATDAGLYSWDKNTGWNTLKLDNLEERYIFDMSISPPTGMQELWLGTDAGALNYTSGQSIHTGNSGLPSNLVTKLAIHQVFGMFFSTDSGISVLLDEAWYNTAGIDEIYKLNDITGIAVAENNYTYVSTYGGGVGRFRADVDGISGATVFTSDWTRLNTNLINTVYVDDTVQWYGTDAGIAVHYSEFTKWNWETYSVYDGLICDTVLSIVKDGNGHMWFGTMAGISMYDGANWTSYTRMGDEIPTDTVRFLAVDTDGSVWMASGSGLSHFDGSKWLIYKD